MNYISNQKLEPIPIKKSVFVKTFGCQMNEYDTEKMLMLLSSEYQRVDSAENADLVLVNTCSVREKSEHKLYGLLGRLRELKEERPELLIGVGGCVAQQDGEYIIKRNNAVDFVIGTHNISLLPSLVKGAKDGLSSQVAIDYTEEWDELPDEFNALPLGQNLVPSTFSSSVRALVAIQRGCNKKCAFCVVPTTRGPQVSRARAEILKEIKLKVRMGAKEVLLLGQTVNSYGQDLSPRTKFSDLVKEIADIEGVDRIRFISPHPAEFKRDFISLFGTVPSLCPQIHLPLQSGSNRVLKLMNRNYRRERYLDIVEELRQVRPDIAISTDVICGFPSETDEDFAQTLEILDQVRFNCSFSFKYSPRPGTESHAHFSSDQEVPEGVKQNRLEAFQRLQNQISLEYNTSQIGTKQKILIESLPEKDYSARGRSEYNVPVSVFSEAIFDSDSLQPIELTKKLPSIGSLIDVKILRASPHGLKAVCFS